MAEAPSPHPGPDSQVDRDEGDRPPCVWASAAALWLALDAEIARPAYDATGEEGRGFAGLRSPGTVLREVSFAAGERTVELEIAVADDQVRVLGQVIGGHAGSIRVLWPGGEQTTGCDETGTFRVDGLPRAPISFHVAGDRPLKTGWVVF